MATCADVTLDAPKAIRNVLNFANPLDLPTTTLVLRAEPKAAKAMMVAPPRYAVSWLIFSVLAHTTATVSVLHESAAAADAEASASMVVAAMGTCIIGEDRPG